MNQLTQMKCTACRKGEPTVTDEWWTHKIGGLHRNDFIMAARSDRAYATAEGRKE